VSGFFYRRIDLVGLENIPEFRAADRGGQPPERVGRPDAPAGPRPGA